MLENVVNVMSLGIPENSAIQKFSIIMPSESYHRRLRSLLLYLCDIFRSLIDPLERSGPRSV